MNHIRLTLITLIITPCIIYSMEKHNIAIKNLTQEDIEKVFDANNARNNLITNNTPVGNLPILYSVVQRQENRIKQLSKALEKAESHTFWCSVIFSGCMIGACAMQFFPLFYGTQQSCNFSVDVSHNQGDTCSNPWFKL